MNHLVEFQSQDLCSVRVDGRCHTVEAVRLISNRRFNYSFNLTGHALSESICTFLVLRGPLWPASTLVGYCNAFVRLLELCRSNGHERLSGETFAAYLEWLKVVKASRTLTPLLESTRRGYANFVLKFIEWLADTGMVRAHDVWTARLRHQKAFRGSSARQLEKMRTTAVSPDNYIRLITAIRLEYEECKIVWDSCADQDQYEQTFPLLPFSMLLGSELALRPVELNYLYVGDLRGDRLLLNPPDKEASEVTLSSSLTNALELAQKWMSRYRKNPRPEDPLLVCQLSVGKRSHHVVRFDTIILNNSLKKFYQKYFDIIDPDGMPRLFTLPEDEDSNLRPFALPFPLYRSAAITDVARHERNPDAVRRFARHRSFSTTEKYYIRETHRQWMTNIATALAPSAELFRISLNNKVANRREEEVAQGANAEVAGGHCEQALSGDRSCRRAVDCRLCVFFRIHISKREFFVKEREEALEQAQSLKGELGLTRDAQNLREFAALNQAIVNRIDECISGQ